jgi:transcriptional regulator with XRE-family HTH domain
VSDLRRSFGANLRQCRKLRRLSQSQLAEAADLSLDMIGRLERGTAAPSFETIEALVAALDVPASALFGESFSGIADNSERSKLLHKVIRMLSGTSDADLRRAERIIAALLKA